MRQEPGGRIKEEGKGKKEGMKKEEGGRT